MGERLRFRILGPLRVSADTGEVALGGGRRQRTVLTVLLANAGHIVPLEHLIDAVWEEPPPSTAKRQIQNSLAVLRRVVATGRPNRQLIHTEGPGYRIVPDGGDLDAQVFNDLVAEARALAGRDRAAEAAAGFRSALALWRGPALFGLTGRVVEAAATRLDDQRLAAAEEWADLELGLGRHADLVGELTELVAANPLRERLVGQLMLALYRSGRQADALHTYHGLRTTLADELGVDPDAGLRQTYAAILANDPAAAAPAGHGIDLVGPRPPVGDAPPPAVMSHLPRAALDFVGRSATLTRLMTAVTAEPGAPPPILAISGMTGVGKPNPEN